MLETIIVVDKKETLCVDLETLYVCIEFYRNAHNVFTKQTRDRIGNVFHIKTWFNSMI